MKRKSIIWASVIGLAAVGLGVVGYLQKEAIKSIADSLASLRQEGEQEIAED